MSDYERENSQIALMAAILLTASEEYRHGLQSKLEIGNAVKVAEQIYTIVWDRNSAYQVECGVIDAAEQRAQREDITG